MGLITWYRRMKKYKEIQREGILLIFLTVQKPFECGLNARYIRQSKEKNNKVTKVKNFII